MQNWIELPVNPPDARKIQIHNLLSGTTYEFQVIGKNEFGDGMYSQIVEARTKGKFLINNRTILISEIVLWFFSFALCCLSDSYKKLRCTLGISKIIFTIKFCLKQWG